MTTRIVVPLDQSAVAEAALPLARGIASDLDARVTLLSVLDVPASFGAYVRTPVTQPTAPERTVRDSAWSSAQSPYGRWSGWSSSEPTAKQIEEVANETEAAERYLAGVAKTFDTDHVETIVRFGAPAERILETAEERDNAMVILASHGRSGLGRAVIGSVTARVVQATHSPVFVVRAVRGATGAGSIGPIRDILVPIDGSTFSEQAFPVIERYFKHDDTTVHLLHVIDTPRFANVQQAEGYTQWLSEQVGASGIDTSGEVVHGWSPGDQINEAAERHGVDLIAMSTHGRTGLSRFVLGSVAERVLHNAERPLLLVPART